MNLDLDVIFEKLGYGHNYLLEAAILWCWESCFMQVFFQFIFLLL